MKKFPKFSIPMIVAIIGFIIIFPTIYFIDWTDKNVVNPRIWQDWTCEQMQKFAMEGKVETLNDFQQVRFDEDLLECMSQ